MEGPRVVVATGVACYLFGLVGQSVFVTTAPRHLPNSAPGAAQGRLREEGVPRPSQGPSDSGLPLGALALGAGALAGGLRTLRGRTSRTASKAQETGDGVAPTGPVYVYSKALMDAATKKNEAVPVAKDVMKIKQLLLDEDWLEGDYKLVVNTPTGTQVEKARELIKLFGPFESTIMEKFVVFLAKKTRLSALKWVCIEYVNAMFKAQSLAPVLVRSAEKLTDEQMSSIKEKMKAKTGTDDIKLICETSSDLIGGLVVEWGFTDPEDLRTGTMSLDYSLRSLLSESALSRGVVAQL